MLQLYRRGLSRTNRGGTLLAYGTNVSHLIRYCHQNDIRFIDLTDSHFTLFVKTLQGQRSGSLVETVVRSANTVIAIGRTCLDFLRCTAEFHGEQDLIAANGRIRAERKVYKVRGASGREMVRNYWHHHSFPTEDVKKRRLPVASDYIGRMRDAVFDISSSIYLRKRRYIMIRLLESTGGRRSEVAGITVQSVIEAAQMKEPYLRMPTTKQRGGRSLYRFVPVSRQDVHILLEFISKNRARIIRKSCGSSHDKGFLLVSQSTGAGLVPNTITQEVRLLRVAAGIDAQVCAHMFRHRFITKLFVTLIEQHEVGNPDAFRRALLEGNALKQKIQQFSGHATLQSLDVYINLAFEELSGFKATYDVFRAKQALESARASLKCIQEDLALGLSSQQTVEQLDQFMCLLAADLEEVRTKI